MLILIEGVDGSGKSTLCKQLEEKGYKIYKDERDFDANRLCAVQNMWSSPVKYVCDRSFVTDIIYRTVYGGKHGPTSFNKAIKFLDQNYRKDSCKVIYCNSLTAFEDSMKRGEDNVMTASESVMLRRHYESFLNICNEWLKLDVMRYDWHYDNVDDAIKFIEGGKNI